MMTVPTRIYFHGDKVKAEGLRGFGKKVLSKLEESLAFNNLPTGTDSITLRDGSRIEATKTFNETIVNIFVPTGGAEEEEVSCLCGKYFAEGVVVAVTPVDGYVTPAQLYTVDVCQSDGTQITVKNCVAQDFSEMVAGDRVWCCLAIREVISSPQFPLGHIDAVDRHKYDFSAPWGASGTEQGFTYAYGGDGNYDVYNMPVNISSTAIGPCSFGVDVPADEWLGVYPRMCSLTPDITDCFWHYKTVDYGFTKSKETLYSEYAMLEISDQATDPEKDYDIIDFYNLQIVPYHRLPADTLGYELKVGRVIDINTDDKTVTVKLVSKFNHYMNTDSYKFGRMYENHGVTIEGVDILMQTDKYYFASDEEREELDYNEDAWSIFLRDFSYNEVENATYVYVMVKEDATVSGQFDGHVIACFRDNYVPKSEMVDVPNKRLSQRLFSTNAMYIRFYIEPKWYFFDMVAGTIVNELTDAEQATLDISIYVPPGFILDYADYVFSGALLTEHNSAYFGGWEQISVTEPEQCHFVYFYRGIDETDATAYEHYHYFLDGEDCGGLDYINQIMDIPTKGMNETVFGGEFADVGNCSASISLISPTGLAIDINGHFYRNSSSAGAGSFAATLSVLDNEISTTSPYDITVRGQNPVSVSAGKLGYSCLGLVAFGLRGIISSYTTEVCGAEIHVNSPYNTDERMTDLEAAIISRRAGFNHIPHIGYEEPTLVVKPYGLNGDDFNESFTLTDYI